MEDAIALPVYQNKPTQHVDSHKVLRQALFDHRSFDIRNVLSTFALSKRFLKNYEANVIRNEIVHRELNDSERKKICNAIVLWALESDILLRSIDYPHIFDCIKSIFHEELYTNYYTPSTSYVTINPKTNKQYRKQIVPSGSLYNSWKYQISQLREEEKEMGNDISKFYLNKNAPNEKVNVVYPETDATLLELKNWLSHSFDPYSLIIENWKKTFTLRATDLRNKKKNFEDIIEEWPQYKRKILYELLDIDYNSLFPNKDTFKDRWSKYRKSIIDLGLSQKHNTELKKKIAFYEGVKDDEKNVEGLLALHALFNIIPNKNSSSKKNLDKILLKAKPGVKLRDMLIECSKKATNSNFSPIIIYEEDEDCLPIKFYTCFNDMPYEFDNIVSAVDLLFKSIFVFDLSYASECNVFCTFIQHFFFNLYYESGFRGSSLIKWMSRLDKTIARDFENRILTQDFDVKIKNDI